MAEASKGEHKKGEQPEEEEEISLPVPDFDEAEHMAEEVEKGKLAVLNTGYGILLAAISAVVIPLAGMPWNYGWFILLIGLLGLRHAYKLGGVTTHEWSGKEWVAAYFTLFFSFLAFWYVFNNPPFV